MTVACRAIALLWGVLVLSAILAGSVCAQNVSTPAEIATPSDVITIPLAFTKDTFALSVTSFQANREVTFKKEPAYPNPASVRRGAILLGVDSADYLGYAWDVEGGKVYIDANRNLELTDDSGAEYPLSESGYFSEVKGISVSLTRNNVPIPYCFDMQSFGDYYTILTVRSGWSGEFDSDGKRYTLGVADNLDGRIGQGDSFLLTEAGAPGTEEPADEPAPSLLVLNGTPYRLQFAFAAGAQAADAVATLTKVTQGLGELRIEGTSIKRVLLNGGFGPLNPPGQDATQSQDWSPFCTIDHPGSTVRIPVGSYSVSDVYLDGGLHRAPPQGGAQSVLVTEAASATLKVGGPLEPSLQITGSGRTLSLSYELTGAQDKPFAQYVKCTNIGGVASLNTNPRFEVYAGGKKVGEGQFEYG